MKVGTYVFLCVAVLTLYECTVVLASVGRRVCVGAEMGQDDRS